MTDTVNSRFVVTFTSSFIIHVSLMCDIIPFMHPLAIIHVLFGVFQCVFFFFWFNVISNLMLKNALWWSGIELSLFKVRLKSISWQSARYMSCFPFFICKHESAVFGAWFRIVQIGLDSLVNHGHFVHIFKPHVHVTFHRCLRQVQTFNQVTAVHG